MFSIAIFAFQQSSAHIVYSTYILHIGVHMTWWIMVISGSLARAALKEKSKVLCLINTALIIILLRGVIGKRTIQSTMDTRTNKTRPRRRIATHA